MNRIQSLRSYVCFTLLALPLGCAAPVESEDTIEEARQATQTEVLDQQATTFDGAGDYPGSSNPMAQIITAGRTGLLSRVSIKAAPCYEAWESSGNSCWFTMRIRAVNAAGEPTSVVLATQRAREPAAAESGGAFGWADVTFTSPAYVKAGTKYAIEIQPDWWMQVPLGAGYASGEVMKWYNNYWAHYAQQIDLLFRTWVIELGPVLGNARCEDRVRLRSWKGDYLHRPVPPGDVTSYDVRGAIGNEWTVKCEREGAIQLRSWNGDYLHRPDSPQGVTMWSFGVWNPETTASGNIQLRSWKNDYLHRPDSPQGVTTWGFGEWAVEVLP